MNRILLPERIFLVCFLLPMVWCICTPAGAQTPFRQKIPDIRRTIVNESDSVVVVRFGGAVADENRPINDEEELIAGSSRYTDAFIPDRDGAKSGMEEAYLRPGEAMSLVFSQVNRSNPVFYTCDVAPRYRPRSEWSTRTVSGVNQTTPSLYTDAPVKNDPVPGVQPDIDQNNNENTVGGDRSCGTMGSFMESGTTKVKLPGRRVVQTFINQGDCTIEISYSHAPRTDNGDRDINADINAVDRLEPGGHVTRVFLNVTEQAIVYLARLSDAVTNTDPAAGFVPTDKPESVNGATSRVHSNKRVATGPLLMVRPQKPSRATAGVFTSDGLTQIVVIKSHEGVGRQTQRANDASDGFVPDPPAKTARRPK